MPDVVTQSMLDHIALEANIGGYEASALKAAEVKAFYSQTAKLINGKVYLQKYAAVEKTERHEMIARIPFYIKSLTLPGILYHADILFRKTNPLVKIIL
jgi:hypothetical protein